MYYFGLQQKQRGDRDSIIILPACGVVRSIEDRRMCDCRMCVLLAGFGAGEGQSWVVYQRIPTIDNMQLHFPLHRVCAGTYMRESVVPSFQRSGRQNLPSLPISWSTSSPLHPSCVATCHNVHSAYNPRPYTHLDRTLHSVTTTPVSNGQTARTKRLDEHVALHQPILRERHLREADMPAVDTQKFTLQA